MVDDEGGIVEELIEGADLRSPSVQLRVSPAGQVDIMSTERSSERHLVAHMRDGSLTTVPR